MENIAKDVKNNIELAKWREEGYKPGSSYRFGWPQRISLQPSHAVGSYNHLIRLDLMMSALYVGERSQQFNNHLSLNNLLSSRNPQKRHETNQRRRDTSPSGKRAQTWLRS